MRTLLLIPATGILLLSMANAGWLSPVPKQSQAQNPTYLRQQPSPTKPPLQTGTADQNRITSLGNMRPLEVLRLARENGAVIIPIGSIEDHGADLPLASDTIVAEAIADAVARNTKQTVVAPTIPYSLHLTGTPQTGAVPDIAIGAESFRTLLDSILISLHTEYNLNTIILLYGHDMPLVNRAASSFFAKHSDDTKVEEVYTDLHQQPELIVRRMGHADTAESSLVTFVQGSNQPLGERMYDAVVAYLVQHITAISME